MHKYTKTQIHKYKYNKYQQKILKYLQPIPLPLTHVTQAHYLPKGLLLCIGIHSPLSMVHKYTTTKLQNTQIRNYQQKGMKYYQSIFNIEF